MPHFSEKRKKCVYKRGIQEIKKDVEDESNTRNGETERSTWRKR
jgi:hypothetical protein